MTNKEWFDKYTNHIIDTELYAEGRADVATSMLRKMSRELKAVVESYGVVKSKAKQKECEKECDDCIENYFSDWKKKEDKERQEHAEKEADWLSAALKAAFGVAVIASLPKTKNALEAPFSKTDNFDSFVEGIKESAKKAVRTPLLSSRIFGTSTAAVSESLDSSFRKISTGFETGVKTSVTGLQRNVQRQLLEGKRKLRFLYVSMLDDSVCVVCGGYSGNVYEDLSEAPEIPVHFRCRCYYLPILSSSKDIIKGENYQQWFDRQPDSVKYKILGATRYNFYKSGLSDITKFSSKGRKLTLKEIFPKIYKKENPIKLYPAKSRILFTSKTGGKIIALYEKTTNEEALNILATKCLASQGKEILLLKDINKQKIKTNDIMINGVKWEIKTITKKSKNYKTAIDSAIKTGHKQADNIILNLQVQIDEISLRAYIVNRVRQHKNIKSIIIEKEGIFINEYNRGEIIKWYSIPEVRKFLGR